MFLFLIATPKISMIIKILTKRLTHVYFMYFAALFSYSFSAFAGCGSSFPIFFIQLTHNKRRVFFCKKQKRGHKQQNLSGNSCTGLMPEVSGPKRKARGMDEAVETAFAFKVLKEKITTEELILEPCVLFRYLLKSRKAHST